VAWRLLKKAAELLGCAACSCAMMRRKDSAAIRNQEKKGGAREG